MYQKVLTAVDSSPRGKQVFEVALTIAQATHAELMLLHILSQDSEDSPVSFAPFSTSYSLEILKTYQQEWESFKTRSLKQLEIWSTQANQAGVKTKFTQITGGPGPAICKFAQEWGADLVVMGRRGHSTVSEMLLGSVSSYVIHRSHCSVHIVQSW
jgi:nucleotide-binding universal stress UspA family protein